MLAVKGAGTVVGRVTILWAGQCGVHIPVGTGEFIFYNVSLSTLGPTWPPVKWVTRLFLRGKATGACS
jgi:hypothetical protein